MYIYTFKYMHSVSAASTSDVRFFTCLPPSCS